MNIAGLDLAQTLGLLTAVVIPLVSALLSRAHWNQEITGILTLALSTASGFFTEWAHAGSSWDWKPAVIQTLATFVLAVVAHKGVWKATPTEAKLLAFPQPKPAQPGAA